MDIGNVANTKSDHFFHLRENKKAMSEGKGIWFTTEFSYNMFM